ncbi:hypothetical protein ACFL1H_03430 [Nanoarchaeota archaeon]
MIQKLEKIIDSIDAYESNFYGQVIDLHNNERLRELAGKYKNFTIVERKKGEYGKELIYGKNGFYLVPVDNDGMRNPQCDYKVKDCRMLTSIWGVNYEMLQTYPQLTVNQIELKLEDGIKKLDSYVLGGE